MTRRVRINQKTVDNARPESKDYWLRDDLIPGFCVKVTPTGKKLFNLDYLHRPTGRNKRWKLGDARWLKASEAREEARELKRKVMKDIYPTPIREVETVGNLCEAYIERHEGEWKTTQPQRYLRKFVLPEFRDVPVTHISLTVVTRWLDELKKEGEASSNRHHALVYFKRAWRWAYSVGRTSVPLPFENAQAPHRTRPRKYSPSDEEWARLGEHLRRMYTLRRVNPFGLLAIHMLAYTGCRIKEVRGMKMQDIDLKGQTIFIPEHKTDRVDPSPKVVEITPHIFALIARCLEDKLAFNIPDNPYLFPATRMNRGTASKTTAISEKGLQHIWQQLRKAAATPMEMRNFRSAKVSLGKHLGMPAEQIADVTKHRDIRVLMKHYMASNRAEVQARANELTDDIHQRMFGT